MILMILTASCMKRYNCSFYVDLAKRCVPWGVLKWEQQETERLCSLFSASSAAEKQNAEETCLLPEQILKMVNAL